jgi:histidyl-tRNA synthetase
LRLLEDRLTAHVSEHGYRRIETPVIEHATLFARKLGGERLAQTYQFTFRGRELALRPEHTAAVMRVYVERMQVDPLPIRLSYGGPVFRYESPQAGRTRQFVEFGCELIGAEGLVADAETILLALSSVGQAGVIRPRLVLGHIGVVLGFLDQLRLDHRTQDWLIWSMERIRRAEPGATDIPPHLMSAQPVDGVNGAALLEGMDRTAAVELLRQSGGEFEAGSRSAEDIVDGLFGKRQRGADREVLEDAVGFVTALVEHSGPPIIALPALRDLVGSRRLDLGPIDELERIVRILNDAGVDSEDIHIDLGLARGLRYYTGMLFEIYPPGAWDSLQIAGGGRYDDLAGQLGARSTVPSAGFSIGLERLASIAAMDATPVSIPAVLVLPGEDVSEAFRLAARLRETGWHATLEVRGRGGASARRWAARNGFAAVARMADSGIEIVRCSDGALESWSECPAPEQVAAR